MEFFSDDYLIHHGVQGQKWGVRRYQNPDGSLTDMGKKRVAKLNAKIDKTYDHKTRKLNEKFEKADAKAKKEFENINQNLEGKTREFRKAAIAQTKASNALHKKVANDIYQKRLSEIRKEEVRSGMNYFENARNRDLLVSGLLNDYVGTGMLIYDMHKYSPGRAERKDARKTYKSTKKRNSKAAKNALKRNHIKEYTEILREANSYE